MKIFLLFLLFVVSVYASQKPLQKVSLQLVWLDQFQFAGYYMAKEKGFYKQVGLDVDIKPFKYAMDTVEEVMSGRATFGVGRSSLIRLRSQGKPIVLLCAIFQSSPFVLLALESSNIKNVKDFVGKTLMLTKNAVETASIHAMITSNGVDEKDLKFKEHNFDFEEFLDGRVDLYAGYTSNEPYILNQRDIAYKIFSPKEDGFDFYSDILFTSQNQIAKDKKMVARFQEASIKGWKYAFEHIQESVELVYKKYNSQNKTLKALLYEANELKKLAYTGEVEFGNINKKKIFRIYDVYKIMGLTKNEIDIRGFIFNNKEDILNNEEREYLKKKKNIKICVDPDAMPYSAIKDEKYIGIGASVLEMISEEMEITFKLVQTKTWEESLQKAIQKECDILPISQASLSRKKYFNFTTPYYHEPLAIVTNRSQNYILDIQTILDKEFSIEKGSFYVQELKRKYPAIRLHYVDSLRDGFRGVENGDYYGHIGIMMQCAYALGHLSKIDLKIAGQFEDKVAVSFAIRDDDKVLFDIFEKISRSIKPKDMQKILNEWVSINYVKDYGSELFKKTLIVLFILIAIFLYRQYILKKKNIELNKLQDELIGLNKSLEHKVADAVSDIVKKDAYLLHQSRLAQMGEMLSMIAHQWKQPLSSISATQIAVKMAIELDKYDLNDEKQRKEFVKFVELKLDQIGTNTQNLSQIISDFSDFYKPNKESKILKFDKVVAKACNIIVDILEAKGIELKLSLKSKKDVRLHENEFMQVIINIINNAKEQLIDKKIINPTISIDSFDKDGYIYLQIKDNAGGIEDDIIEKIFDPYFSTKLEKNGTGLGLYMSKNIIEGFHNGKLSVENDGDGAVFTIRIGTEDL